MEVAQANSIKAGTPLLPNVATIDISADTAGGLWGSDSSFRIFRYTNIP